MFAYSQQVFEKGYFIDQEGSKTECWIKNEGWKKNPSKFKYTINENDKKVFEHDISNTKEFGIDDSYKFIRDTVEIDTSGSKGNSISHKRTPEFRKEVLFLKVLMEGDVSLYTYENDSFKRFFIKTQNSGIEQLIYKPYISEPGKLFHNTTFRNQLSEFLKCPAIDKKEFETLGYNEKAIQKMIEKYHKYLGKSIELYDDTPDEFPLRITVKPGVRHAGFSIGKTSDNLYNVAFDDEKSFQMGIEFEYILPFNQNKWSFVLEPLYQYYKTEITKPWIVATIDYNSIDLYLGFRHAYYLGRNSKIYIDGGFITGLPLSENTINYKWKNISVHDPEQFSLKIIETLNLGVGAGYSFKNRYNIGFSYGFKRKLSTAYNNFYSDYRTYSLVLGYTLF
jgi:hypothetical protein